MKSILPKIKDYRYLTLKGDGFPFSVNMLLKMARRADARGKKSKWYMEGGPERNQATELYRVASRYALRIYGANSLEVANLFYEFAKHVEERHEERGRPENSRWNRCASVPED